MTSNQAATKARATVKTDTKPQFPVIGYSCWWTISKIEVSEAELEKVTKVTIGEDFMKEIPGKKRALRTALNAMDVSGLIRKIRDDEEVIAYTFHEEIIDKKAIDLDLKKEQVIIYDKKADKLDIRMDYKKDEIKSLFEKYQKIFTESDIRGMVLQFIKFNNGVTMRDSGGIYFLTNANARNKIKAFIESKQVGGTFYNLGVPDMEEDRTTMSVVISDELKREVTLAAEEFKQLQSKNGDRSKIDSFETRLDRFKALRSKIEMFSALIGNIREDLSKTVDTLNGEVMKSLTGELKEYPQAKLFPYKARVNYKGKAKDRYGDVGTVVGYCFWTDAKEVEKPYVRVLFDKTDKVEMVTVTQLELHS